MLKGIVILIVICDTNTYTSSIIPENDKLFDDAFDFRLPGYY